MLLEPERDIDRDQKQLVRERIEIAAKLGMKFEPAGKEAINRIAQPGDDEDNEGQQELARDDQPNGERHKQDTADRDEIGKAHEKDSRLVTEAILHRLQHPRPTHLNELQTAAPQRILKGLERI